VTQRTEDAGIEALGLLLVMPLMAVLRALAWMSVRKEKVKPWRS
jgi:hypothetical protein